MKIKRWDVSVLDSKNIIQKHDSDFFTTDTDAVVQVHLVDTAIRPKSATVVLYNQHDESLVEEEIEVNNNLTEIPFYTEGRNLIEHSGGWLITVIFQYEGKRYTTREIPVFVNKHDSTDIPDRLEIINNWNAIKAEIVAMQEAEIIRESNEAERMGLYNEVQTKLDNGDFVGEQGPQGIQGEKGEQGEQGIQGEQGVQGEKGEQGEQGIQGEQGVQGEKGEQGEQGIQGEKGEQGEQGIQGEQGVQGEQGIQGEKGEQGEQGIQGEVGPVGPAPDWQVISSTDYDALNPPDPNTVYLVTDANSTETDTFKMAVDIMLGGDDL